jgi:hypothetical protein
MVYVNHELKASFLHIPKCGGVYVRTLLLQFYNFDTVTDRHPNIVNFLNTDGELDSPDVYDKHVIRKYGKYRYFYTNPNVDRKVLEEYYTFTFVRNPYDRIYSAYKYLLRCLSQDGNKIRHLIENPEYFKDFNTFIQNKDNVNGISYFHAFITQYDQLLDTSNNIKISFIGKTETLDNDFMQMLVSFGVPKHMEHLKLLNNNVRYNKSNTNTIENEINETSLAFINKHFKNDFDYFGYKICNTLDELKQYYGPDKTSLINATRLTTLVTTYSYLNNIQYNLWLNQMNTTKLVNINKILFETISSTAISANTINELSSIKTQFEDVSDYNEIVTNCKSNIINAKTLLLSQIKDEQHLFINECNICKYKTYNELATNVHKMLCSDINIKDCYT